MRSDDCLTDKLLFAYTIVSWLAAFPRTSESGRGFTFYLSYSWLNSGAALMDNDTPLGQYTQ
jgi:hypothetical protein